MPVVTFTEKYSFILLFLNVQYIKNAIMQKLNIFQLYSSKASYLVKNQSFHKKN